MLKTNKSKIKKFKKKKKPGISSVWHFFGPAAAASTQCLNKTLYLTSEYGAWAGNASLSLSLSPGWKIASSLHKVSSRVVNFKCHISQFIKGAFTNRYKNKNLAINLV